MASISKRPGRPKPWYCQWREPETKAQRWRAFTTKREADAFRDTVSSDLRAGTYVSLKPVPFAGYATDWLARRRPTVGPNTVVTFEWAVGKYLIPAFGNMPLQHLNPERIERWQADLLTEGALSARSVQVVRNVLGAILGDAFKKDRIKANPMDKVDPIKVTKREMHCLTVDQLKALCQAAGRVYGVLFLLSACCGLRSGEALALQWPDMDLDRGRLWVRRQVLWRRRKDCPPGEPRWTFAEPKSEAGKRAVEIPAALLPFLQAHREQQNGGPNPHDLVFPNSDGGPLEGRNVRRRHFAPALARLGIEGIRPHDFRRTFIAMHVEAGTHAKLVQSRVGHSDFRLTMDVYGRRAGDLPLGEQEEARFNDLAARALPDLGKQPVNTSLQNGLQSPKVA